MKYRSTHLGNPESRILKSSPDFTELCLKNTNNNVT